MNKKTENEVAKTEAKTTELAPLTINPFEQYGNQVSQRNIVGRLLKFNKGDWLAGEDNEEIPIGKKLTCNMNELLVGWIRWMDNKPDQQIMGKVAEAYQAPKRNTLGDVDEALWEVGQDGKARDPWQFSNYMLMKEVGKKASDATLYTFATSSRGGLGMLGELCKVYGAEMRKRPDEWPIVELGKDSYDHPNKEFGRIKTPKMTVVGWEKKTFFDQDKAEKNGKAAAA